MKIHRILLVALFTILFFTTCKKEDETTDKPTIQVSGIEFTPNFFIDNEKIVGIDADIAATAMQKAGVDVELSMAQS